MLFSKTIQIDKELVSSLLESWEKDNYSVQPEQFWCYWEDGNRSGYTVIDNRGYEFFMEDFKTPEAAHAWLRGVDVDICYQIEKTIVEHEEAVALANKEYEDSIYDDYVW